VDPATHVKARSQNTQWIGTEGKTTVESHVFSAHAVGKPIAGLISMKIVHSLFRAGATLTIAGLALSAFSLQAATIASGGASTGPGGDIFSISGPGFSMNGRQAAYPFTGACAQSDCAFPGTYRVSDGMSSEMTGSGMSGSYTVGGTTYNYSCNAGTYCYAGIDFSGSFTLPDFGSTPPSDLSVTTSFSSTGGISGLGYPGNPDPPLEFTGSGIATINLHLSSPGSYHFTRATYTFASVPEPGSGSLAGIGLLLTGIVGLSARWPGKKAAVSEAVRA
jgi:hypothetical protein